MDLTVVVPTKDRLDVLPRTLDALARQELGGRSVEVLVVDNGSTDGTLEHLAQAPDRLGDAELRVLHEPTPGVSAARNAAVRAARGTVVLFLNDDSVAASDDLLAGHLSAHHGRSDVAVLGRVTYAPDVLADPFHVFLDSVGQFDYASLEAGGPTRAHHFITANISFAKAAYDRAGGMDERLPFGFEDAILGDRMLRAGVHIVYEPGLVVIHDHATPPAAWRHRTLRMGAAGRRANVLRSRGPLLAPHTVGPYWVAQQVGADLLARLGDHIRRLPQPMRHVAFKLLHQGTYVRGYRQALHDERRPGR